MTLSQRFLRIKTIKFSFARSVEYTENFARESGACSMYDLNFGLGISGDLSPGNQLRGVFREIMNRNGTFLFNINSVDIKKAMRGFSGYDEAASNNQITEWELFMILNNRDYQKNCIFHNGKVQFKKTILWRSVV